MNELIKSIALRVPAVRRVKDERDRMSAQLEETRRELAVLKSASSVPATGVNGQLDQISQGLSNLRATIELEATAKVPKYEVLEGTPYSRYAVPIEYMPSRDFQPRWGYAKPLIPSIDAWFRGLTGEYTDFIRLMRKNAQHLAHIPLEFAEANLPEPAWGGVPYCAFDAVALYTMVRQHAPKRYLEIGSGITTCFTYKAIQDAKLKTNLTSIDPEPRAKIDKICNGIIRDGLETCVLTIFDELEAGDILFFDGSHRSFMNSDVTVFFIDVLPRIKPGVIIHIHDISLPWDYDHYFKNWYWNEQYLLAVYMMGNRHRIKPLAPTSFMCRNAAFESEFATPMLDLGKYNDGWRGGGAMWFTHTA
jgi:Methyltransferase domain